MFTKVIRLGMQQVKNSEKKYGELILFIAVGGAAVGTLTGALPGTKPKAK